MSYKDCPHCHKVIELEIEGDDGYLCPIIIPKPKAGEVIEPKDRKETHWDKLELERRLGK